MHAHGLFDESDAEFAKSHVELQATFSTLIDGLTLVLFRIKRNSPRETALGTQLKTQLANFPYVEQLTAVSRVILLTYPTDKPPDFSKILSTASLVDSHCTYYRGNFCDKVKGYDETCVDDGASMQRCYERMTLCGGIYESWTPNHPC